MDKLLLEIGSEEIPAGYIEPALNAMASRFDTAVGRGEDSYGRGRSISEPLEGLQLLSMVSRENNSHYRKKCLGHLKKSHSITVVDQQRRPEKFAEKVGVSVKRLKVKQTDKGRYLFAMKTERGLASRTLLKTILPKVIETMAFPKRMKWGELHVTFARPDPFG